MVAIIKSGFRQNIFQQHTGYRITPALRDAWEAKDVGQFCEQCENCGWECYGIGHNDPHFKECESCGNPDGHPSP